MTTEHFMIDGMTCANCRNRIEEALSKIDGIGKILVNERSGQAEVQFDESCCSMEKVQQVIEDLGYRVRTKQEQNRKLAGKTVGVLTAILVLFLVSDRLGLLNLLVPSALADSHMEYGMLFVVGVLTSFHCLAMCGGIQLSQTLVAANGGNAAILPSFRYNLGRVIGYTLIGAVLGGLSSIFNMGVLGQHSLWQGIFKLIVGILMVICALNLTGLFPGLRSLKFPMPAKWRTSMGRRGKGSPFVIGLINSLMPCGPLQSMWIVALGSGSVLAGGMTMLAFALGTVPVMLGVGALLAGIGRKAAKTFTDIGAILVAVMGLAMFSQGAALSGRISQTAVICMAVGFTLLGIWWNLPMKGSRKWLCGVLFTICLIGTVWMGSRGMLVRHEENKGYVRNGIQYVESELTSGKYPDITVAAGMPVQWIVHADAKNINGCNYEIYSRELGIEHEFTEGDNVIEFTPEKRGTYEYTCWMGMIKANIIVE